MQGVARIMLSTCGEGLLEALTACQVHHEQLPYFDLLQGPCLLPWKRPVPLDDGQHHYGMAAAGMGVQAGEGKHPAYHNRRLALWLLRQLHIQVLLSLEYRMACFVYRGCVSHPGGCLTMVCWAGLRWAGLG